MADPAPPEAWTRLGKALATRRAQLKPAYRNRQAFAEATGLHYRVVFDIETGKRTNYRPPTIAAIETAYVLPEGTFSRFLQDPTQPTEFPHQTPVLTVHITDEPEPATPTGGFSDDLLGVRERAIWVGDEPWQVRLAAIQLIRGGPDPICHRDEDEDDRPNGSHRRQA